jgi:G3E family GTPase
MGNPYPPKFSGGSHRQSPVSFLKQGGARVDFSGGCVGSRLRTSSVASDDGDSSLSVFEKARQATLSRLRGGPNDENERIRLERRLENIDHLELLFQQHPELSIPRVFGWGEGCFGAQSGQGVSEFDTFFISNGAKEVAVKLDSTYQVQRESLSGQSTLIATSANRDAVAMSLSQSGRVYEKKRDGFSPQYLYQGQAYHSSTQPYGIQLCVPKLVNPAVSMNAVPTVVSKAPLAQFIRTVGKYQSTVKDPIVLDVLEKIQEKIGVGAKEVQPLLDSGKSTSFAVIHDRKIHIGFDASDEGWPLVAASSLDLPLNAYTSARASFLKRMTGREDWPSKWFFVLTNTVSQDNFFHLNVPVLLKDQIVGSPQIADTILRNIAAVPVNKKAMQALQSHLKDRTTRTVAFATQENALLMKAFRNPDTTCSYKEFEGLLRFSDRFELVAQAVSHAAVSMGIPVEKLMKSMAYQVKTWEKVSDRFGICCPSCADNGDCAVPKRELILSHVADTDIALPDLTRLSSGSDILSATQQTMSRVMGKLSEDASSVTQRIAAFFETIQCESLPNDFRLASVLSYLIELHDAISDYDPKGLLKAEKTCLLQLAKVVMSRIEPVENATYGLEVQTRICHFLTMLETQNLLRPDEKNRYESLYPMVLIGEEALDYANRYTTDYYEKSTVRDMSRPLSDVLYDLLGPLPIDILNGDLGSGKTTFSHKAVHRDSAMAPAGKLAGIFEIYNDITPGLDSTKSLTHLSTFTVVRDALTTLDRLPGFSFEEVSAEKAYAKKEGDATTMLSQETGCLCCTNRVGFAFRVGEVARGLRGWGAQGIWTEITGIGDGSGAAGIAFWPGRTYVRSLSAVLNPADERWGSIPEQEGRGTPEYARDLAAWFADDAGLDVGTDEHRLHKRQEILWSQLSMATHYFINLRSDNPQDATEQKMREKMTRIIAAKLHLEGRQADIVPANFKHMCRWESGQTRWEDMPKLNPAEVFQTGKRFAFSQLEKDMGPSETTMSGMEPRSMRITLSPKKSEVAAVWTAFCRQIQAMATSGENRQIDRLKGYIKVAAPAGIKIGEFKRTLLGVTPHAVIHDTDGGVLIEVEVGAGASMWVGGKLFS